MKRLKTCMLILVFVLIVFLFAGTTVNAAEVNSLEELKTIFSDKNVTFNGASVTLNADVTIDDLVEICNGEYKINLNGHTLKLVEFYVVKGKVTIDDATKKGKIDTRWVGIEEEGTLIVNQCIFETDIVDEFDGEKWEVRTDIGNCGNLTFKNGSVENTIWNEDSGILVIENATVKNLSQFGTATIKGGKFETLNTDISIGTTKILGGEFTGSQADGFAVMIQSKNSVDRHTINTLLPDGYVAKFESFDLQTDEPTDGSKYYTGIYGLAVKIVKASEVYSDVFKKITGNGIWDVSTLAPKDMAESEALLSKLATDIVKSSGYQATAYAYGSTFNPEKVLVCIYNGEKTEEHIVTAKYLKSDSEKAKTVNAVLNKMKYYEDHNAMKVDTAYILDDLYLINYLFANSSNSRVNGEQALNFAKDLINATGGANISFEFLARAGGGNPNALYTFAKGQTIVYYDGVPYTARNAAITASHVLYIPDTTTDTDEAYIAAALKRIKDYMGKDVNITITTGGTLNSLSEDGEDYNEYNLFDETKTGNNYYTVKINGKTYNFAICKKEASKLETPKYIGSNLGSKISITSDVTTIPLDTSISVTKVKNDTIKNALGTSEYAAYDISLYSNAKQVSITKLTSGKFKVSIPVPTNLKDKEITVYYISSKGEREEHIATVKNGIASFETDHFSTYAIVEKSLVTNLKKDETPNTGLKNNFEKANEVAIVSFAGLVVVARKK